MGYLIHYAMREGMLQAAVCGKAGRLPVERIAQDISAEAGRGTVRRVLIDVRGLTDRLGSLGALAMVRCEPERMSGYRVAVVDAAENDAYYALHEMAAQARGYVLRCFSSMADALRWLRSAPGRD
ncbi:MAG TPA: hypothetical protein VLV90_13370 [Burkholderiales bacterium]|nr:hypothetical protein [Burkholderiales bacterium]